MTRVVCVLGMHRSGTSLVTRVLNLLGVDVGPDARVRTAGDDNPKGYWEYRPFVDVNDEIFARFGGSWHEPPVLPADWTQDPRLDDLRARARARIAEDFAASPLWGWKDPRACLTLPFWQEIIGPMSPVICLRNPAEVVASLGLRPTMPVAEPEGLWLTHVRATLAWTREAPRLVVCYEDLIADWRPQVRRLAAFVGAPARAEDPAVLAAIDEHLERKMRHHHVSPTALVADPRLSFATKSLYVALRAEGQAMPSDETDRSEGAAEARAALAALADRAVDAFTGTRALEAERDDLRRTRDTLTGERDQLLAAHVVTSTEREALVTARETLTAERDALTAERNALIAQRELVLEERDAMRARHDALARQFHARITELDATLAAEQASHAGQMQDMQQHVQQLHERITALAAAHHALQQRLEEMHASFAWRLVTRVRHLIVRLLPAGTRRRRAFHALLRGLGGRRASARESRFDADLPVS